MLKLVDQIIQLVLEGNEGEKKLILSCHANSYVTTSFLRYAEKRTLEVIHRIDKMAFTGTDPVKSIILKGYSLMFQRNFKTFNTREEAIAYLISDTTSDLDKKVNPSLHD